MSGTNETTTLQVVTANRLGDGRVVFFAGGNIWSEAVGEAHAAHDNDAAAALLAEAGYAVAARVVVDPYLIDVEIEDDGLRPVRFRERIRAFGPPIHPQFAHGGAGA